jgi:ABC transporter DrrB family efflux protein
MMATTIDQRERPGKKAVRDGWTMTQRNIAHVMRQPEELGLYLGLPIIFVLVFGYVFGSAMEVPDDGMYREFLLPGVFAMTMLYGLGATATAIAFDAQKGVVDRFRSMPMARSALLVGRSVADVFRALIELVVVVVAGLAVGWRWHEGIGNALVALGLILLLRVAMTWVGIYLGLLVPNPDTVGVIVFPLAFPFTAVSSVFLEPQLLPGGLAVLAEWNPISATVAAARDLFGNPMMASDSWATQNALLMAVVWPIVLVAVFAPLAIRRYQKLSR